MSPNSLKRLEMSGPPQIESQSQLKSLNQLDLSFTKAERNNVCQILDLAPKLVHLVYLGNSANQLACIENNNIQELELGFTDMLTVLGKYLLFQILCTVWSVNDGAAGNPTRWVSGFFINKMF